MVHSLNYMCSSWNFQLAKFPTEHNEIQFAQTETEAVRVCTSCLDLMPLVKVQPETVSSGGLHLNRSVRMATESPGDV